MAIKKAGLVWVDAQGERALHVITTDGGVGPIETELEALSQAGVIECWEGLDETYSPSPGTASYPSVRVTAVLYFTDGAGHVARLLLPAPDSSIFMADGSTVDPAAITSLITACVGRLETAAGTTVTAFAGGQLTSTRFTGISSL